MLNGIMARATLFFTCNISGTLLDASKGAFINTFDEFILRLLIWVNLLTMDHFIGCQKVFSYILLDLT